MSIAEVIALLMLYCDREDDPLMKKSIYAIDVHEECIEVTFVDGDTPDIMIERKKGWMI